MGNFITKSRRFFLGSVLVVCVLSVAAHASEVHLEPSSLQHSKIVTIHLSDYRTGLRQLAADGYDVAGVDPGNGTVDVVVHGNGLALLKSLDLGDIVKAQDIDPEVEIGRAHV